MDLGAQLMEAAAAVGIGWVLGVIFDVYRVICNILRPKRFMTAVLDGIYWLIAVLVAFTWLLFSNWAEIRFYIFAGIVVGWISYYKLISTYVLFCLMKSVRCVAVTVLWVKKILVFFIIQPLGYILGIFSSPLRYGGKKIKKMQLWAKK